MVLIKSFLKAQRATNHNYFELIGTRGFIPFLLERNLISPENKRFYMKLILNSESSFEYTYRAFFSRFSQEQKPPEPDSSSTPATIIRAEHASV